MTRAFLWEYISETKRYENELVQVRKKPKKMQQRDDMHLSQNNNSLIKTYEYLDFMNCNVS